MYKEFIKQKQMYIWYTLTLAAGNEAIFFFVDKNRILESLDFFLQLLHYVKIESKTGIEGQFHLQKQCDMITWLQKYISFGRFEIFSL